MGPIVASSCSSRFVSREARFATVEYLPNIGHGDEGELEAIAKLLVELKFARGCVGFARGCVGG